MAGCILYRHFDADGRLLYVGISLTILKRLSTHSRVSPWYERVARIDLERFPDKAAARLAEAEAIKSEKPEFNEMHADANQDGGERRIAMMLSDDEVDAAEIDFDDVTQSMSTISRKHGISAGTFRRLFGERGVPRQRWWRECR